jgi:hypothetical protein|nr:MAG TPA: hypothetical protein [Caudoviricetes sp.]
MASQNIAINIGSSFNGEGMVKAAKSVNDLGQTVNRTAGGVQKMASGIGALGGVMGQLPGKFGAVASGIGDVASSLTTGAGGIATFVAALASLGVAAGKAIFGPVREASKEWAKYAQQLRNMEDGKGTQELYQKRFAKLAEERKRAAAERQKEADKKNRADDAAYRASLDLLKSENALLQTERELAKLRESGKWDEKIAAATDENEKNLISKQKALALAKMSGANSVADAQSNVKEAWKNYRVMRRDSLSEGEYKDREKAGSKRVEEANARLAIAEESAAQAIAQAEREVRAATEALARSRAEAAENDRRRREDAASAERDRAAAAERKQGERDKAQGQLADVNKRLGRARGQRDRAAAVGAMVDAGIAKDQEVHNGISGNGYQYNRDKDGRLTRFDQFRRARRYADRAARDEASANRDGGEDRNARRARDIERNMRKGRNVSDRDKNFLRDWNDFKNQKPEEGDETVTKLEEIKALLEKTLEVK